MRLDSSPLSLYLLVSLSRVSRLRLLARFETQGIVDETHSTSRLMWLASLYNFTYLTEGTRPRKTCSSLLTDLLKLVSLLQNEKKLFATSFFAYLGVQFYFPSVLAALNLKIASHYLTTREARKPYP